MANYQLAVRRNRDVAILRVDHTHVDARHRAPEGARTDLPRRLVVEEDAHHFGHAPDFDQRKTKTLLENTMKLRLGSGADAKAHAAYAKKTAWKVSASVSKPPKSGPNARPRLLMP